VNQMADIVNGVAVSKDLCDVTDFPECKDNNTNPAVAYTEIETFSELSFKTGDDISLSDIIESEFAARISSLSRDASPRDEVKRVVGQPPLSPDTEDQFLIQIQGVSDKQSTPENGGKGSVEMADDRQPTPDTVAENGITITEPDSVTFKANRPSDMPLIASFDPFARIEEDSECSNSNPMSNNVLNSPDEFSFPNSPQETQVPVVGEPMVDLFVKTISDDQLDLSDPAQNNPMSPNNTSSVESVNNSFPNVSDLTSPDRVDGDDDFMVDDLISSEPLETVVDHEAIEGTPSASHNLDLSTDETDPVLEDQSTHQIMDLTGDIGGWEQDDAHIHGSPPIIEEPQLISISDSECIIEETPVEDAKLIDVSEDVDNDLTGDIAQDALEIMLADDAESQPVSQLDTLTDEGGYDEPHSVGDLEPVGEEFESNPAIAPIAVVDETDERSYDEPHSVGDLEPGGEDLESKPAIAPIALVDKADEGGGEAHSVGDLEPFGEEFESKPAPIAVVDEADDWVTVEAALERIETVVKENSNEPDLSHGDEILSHAVAVVVDVTNPDVVTNQIDRQPDVPDDSDTSEVSVFLRLPSGSHQGPLPIQ